MKKSLSVIMFALVAAIGAVAGEVGDPPPIVAARSIHKLLEAGKYAEVHRDWCHPDLRKQMDEEGFVEVMKGDFGKGVTKLFADAIKALDEKAGPAVIVARPQKDRDEFEIVLTKVQRTNPIDGKGKPWHIEFKLDEGKWKLADTD